MSECIETDRRRNACGYGTIYVEDELGTFYLHHRRVWAEANGPIPKGMHVLHTCDNPGCISLDHLWLGTHQENMKDRDAKGRCRAAGPKGVKGSMAKLNVEQVYECRLLWSIGLHTQQQLADRYGITQGKVSDVVHMKTYRHEH